MQQEQPGLSSMSAGPPSQAISLEERKETLLTLAASQ
jgi:hypothetical protein